MRREDAMIPAGIWLGHWQAHPTVSLKMLCPLWVMVCLWRDALSRIIALGSVGDFVWSMCVKPLEVSLAPCSAMDVGVGGLISKSGQPSV